MHARVSHFHVVPSKLDEFLAAARAAIPHARQQKGFRALLVLRDDAGKSSTNVRVISIWNSMEDLQAAEQNFYLYQALAKVMSASKGFPLIENQEVLFADLGGARASSGGPAAAADETQF
ncbi:MAG TPA: antibiotic biosynthesis monooxygenase [Candidatus Acidoferrales bacterium]|nr:antibiotic biosynthesis monooxygenase [Candidatus Acidoferrales bacterium]